MARLANANFIMGEERKRTAVDEVGLAVEKVESLENLKGDTSHHIHRHLTIVHYIPRVGQ